jgi:hypothetical protein
MKLNLATGLLRTLLLAGSLAAAPAFAVDSPMKQDFDAAIAKGVADYKAARAGCEPMKGNERAICQEQAKLVDVRSRSEARAQFIDTPKARVDARKAIADAEFDVAREKCKALSSNAPGNARDVCVSQAKAVHVAAVADANADRKVTAARTHANEEKRTAEYKVEREKCDALNGAEKATCVELAKAKYGK